MDELVSRCFSPCQDAYKIMNFSDSDILDYRGYLNGTILAVADGHGNPICHGSSEFGSRLAVEAAVECVMDLVKEYEKTLDANVFQYFPQMVVTIWRDRVQRSGWLYLGSWPAACHIVPSAAMKCLQKE